MEIMKAVASHIEIDDQGVAWITGANTKVIEVVLDKIAYGWSPEEMTLPAPVSVVGTDSCGAVLLL